MVFVLFGSIVIILTPVFNGSVFVCHVEPEFVDLYIFPYIYSLDAYTTPLLSTSTVFIVSVRLFIACHCAPPSVLLNKTPVAAYMVLGEFMHVAMSITSPPFGPNNVHVF